jgi:hypothetical protein
MLPQQQPLAPLSCMGHWLDEQHIFPSAGFPSLAIMGHFMAVLSPAIMGHFMAPLSADIMGHFMPDLAMPDWAALPAWSGLQQAQVLVSGAAEDGTAGAAVCAKEASANARTMNSVLSFMSFLPVYCREGRPRSL